MFTALRCILVIALAGLAAGCGLKGPLYLPPPVAAPQSTPNNQPGQQQGERPAERPTERSPDRPYPDVPSTSDSK
jgi:predicted small lipoprotein YifL